MSLVIAVATIWPAQGWSQPPCSAAPVVAKPFDTGGSSQFTQVLATPPGAPPPPSFTAPYRWMLVDDFMENAAGGPIRSGFANTTGATKTELYRVNNLDMEDAGITFKSCTVRAQLAATSAAAPTNFNFVVDGVDREGMSVTGISVQEKTSVAMTSHPVPPGQPAGGPWTSNDLYSGTTIGVKNAGGSVGVGIESIILECTK